jgi:hypothetical protein
MLNKSFESEGVARKLRFCAVKRGATGRRESSFKKNTSLGKGEIGVRETTAAKKAAHAESQLKLLRQHPGKSEAEIVEMMN